MSGEWLGYVAAALTTLSFVPQAAKTIRSRDTHGISLAMAGIWPWPAALTYRIGIALWLAWWCVVAFALNRGGVSSPGSSPTART